MAGIDGGYSGIDSMRKILKNPVNHIHFHCFSRVVHREPGDSSPQSPSPDTLFQPRPGFDATQMFQYGLRQSFGQSRVFILRQVGHYQDYPTGSLIGAESEMVVSESLRS